MTGRAWNAARAAFLLAVVVGAWWSWREAGAQVAGALRAMDTASLALAQVLVVVGLAGTGWVWLTALTVFEAETASRAIPPFFVAQLGKYIPGSVWSFAAQGAVGLRRGLPPRTSAAAAVLFLLLHTASGLVVAGLLGWTFLGTWVAALSLAVGVVGLLPATYGFLGRRLAGRPCAWSWRHSLLGITMMVPVWSAYGLALLCIVPRKDLTAAVTLGTAFAVAHAVGVMVPIAPAGVGAREGVLALLLAPMFGVASAAAVALVARVLHSVADFLVAGVAWLFMSSSDARRAGP